MTGLRWKSALNRAATCTATAVAALGLLTAPSVSAAPTGGFVEYPDPGRAPCEGIYHEASGRIFVEEIVNPGQNGNIGAIGVLDPATGAILRYPLPVAGTTAGGAAFGGDGNLWFTYFGASSGVAFLNPATMEFSIFPTPDPASTPTDIWPGPDNAMYFAESIGQRIGRIDLGSHAISETPIPGGGLNVPTTIMMPGRGNKMMVSAALTNSIIEYDTVTHEFTVHRVPTPNAVPQGLTIGSDGAIWFSESFGAKIGRIDPDSGAITEYPIATPEVPAPSMGPLVLGADGNLWSANGGFTGGSTVGRFNTTTHKIDYFALPRPASGPCDIDSVAAANGKLVIGQTTGGAVAVAEIADLNAIK
ncbi:virginiamycin B lyase family protein [Nocardia sp. R6R-6]|uniref:virginiamycin B lyase family protein n=1 Tax=Nocardia sp. R6R-6 TaxID=3459303 RepID=UPI00403D7FFE